VEARKGIEHLLRAFRRVKTAIPNARLILIGEGGLRQKYEAFAARLGLSDVLFEGYVSDADLPAYYQRADVVCAPSTTNESFGITLVEAMASGTPVVATRMGGYAQVAVHGVNGMLVPPGDPESLAESLQQVLEDSSMRDRLIDGGLTRARDFDWPNVADQILGYYAELASSKDAILSTSDI
jgi:phosphatidylinositol alpha-mannosyltransferase